MLDFAESRKKMVEDQIRLRGLSDKHVLSALHKMPRHLFTAPGDESRAYEDKPLPIGYGQTLSQPYIVALMTQELQLSGTERVLEIGTGSGYQCAILAELALKVYTIERVQKLSVQASTRLIKLGYSNIKFKVSDGSVGWVEEAPFDRIIVTAAAPEVPSSLLGQLKEDGLMVIPVGTEKFQELLRIKKEGDGVHKNRICNCVFVKLVGKEGWS